MSAGMSAGTPGVDVPPLAQPPAAIVLPAIHESRLANGLTLIVVPRPGLPVVSLVLSVRAGPEADPTGRAGVAALTVALLSKGAQRHGRAVSATQLAQQAEALGGTLDSDSSWQASSVSMSVTTPQTQSALALLADVLRRPLLAAAELERARTQSLDGLRVALGSPGEVAAMAARRAFWGPTPHGAVATQASLRRITRADVQAFHARWFRPDNALLVLAGDIDPSTARTLAHAALGSWPAPVAALPAATAQAPQAMSETLLQVDLPGSGQSAVLLTAPYLASLPNLAGPLGLTGQSSQPSLTADPDLRAQSRTELRAELRTPQRVAQVANAVLGGGYSARLNQELRIRRGLSYGAFSQAESQPAGGMLTAQAQTRHASAIQALTLMRAEIARMTELPPAADELAARQASLLGSFARRLQTTGGLAALVTGQWIQGRPLADLAGYSDAVLTVRPEQVRDFARLHWGAERLRAVVVGDLAAMGAGWQAEPSLRWTLPQLEGALGAAEAAR